jgi:uncharacterized protein (DUF488 family)
VVERAPVWTVGHSSHEMAWLLRLLQGERIGFAVDVRSYPYSRHAPQFNREPLQRALRSSGIGYVFLGDALGGRPSREEHYDDEGHALYGLMAQEPRFMAAVERVRAGAQSHRLALLCSEADPRECHRRLLVGRVLTEADVELRHILRDGSVMTEESVPVPDDAPTLFGDNAARWRSTRSVSHRRRLSGSSAV